MRRDGSGDTILSGSYIATPTIINLSVASASAGPLTGNVLYRLWSSVDAFFQFGQVGVTASTASHPIKAGLDLLHYVNANQYVAAIVGSGTGAFYVSRYDVNSDNP